VVALGGTEVEVRELVLEHAVGRVGSADGEDGGGAVGAPRAADLADVGWSASHGCCYGYQQTQAELADPSKTDRASRCCCRRCLAKRHGRASCAYIGAAEMCSAGAPP